MIPEKIYCGNNGHDKLSYSNQMFPNAFEYTRNDTFIDKASEWIKENLLNYTYIYDGEVGIGMTVFLEEFRNYMKEE